MKTCVLFVSAAIVVVATSLPAVAANENPDPPYCHRQATWEETMRVSREALLQYEADQAKKKKGPAMSVDGRIIRDGFAGLDVGACLAPTVST